MGLISNLCPKEKSLEELEGAYLMIWDNSCGSSVFHITFWNHYSITPRKPRGGESTRIALSRDNHRPLFTSFSYCDPPAVEMLMFHATPQCFMVLLFDPPSTTKYSALSHWKIGCFTIYTDNAVHKVRRWSDHPRDRTSLSPYHCP